MSIAAGMALQIVCCDSAGQSNGLCKLTFGVLTFAHAAVQTVSTAT